MNNENDKTPLAEEQLEHAAGGSNADCTRVEYESGVCNWCSHFTQYRAFNKQVWIRECKLGKFRFEV